MKTIEPNKQNIETGDRVAVIFAWREDETPTDANFHIGRVTNVFYKEMDNCQLLKFEVEGVDYPVSADRVMLIEKGNLNALPVFVHLTDYKCAEVLGKAKAKGFRGFIVARNYDRTVFEVESNGNTYKQTITYSEITEEIFGSCDCLSFVNRRQLCKHLSVVGVTEIFSSVYQQKLAA